jgi:hypothetical protein
MFRQLRFQLDYFLVLLLYHAFVGLDGLFLRRDDIARFIFCDYGENYGGGGRQYQDSK